MAKGKSVGEYSAKSTSATLSPGPGGSTITAINFEGTGNRAGLGSATIIGTGTFVGGKSGTYSYCGAAFLDNGETNGATGTGTYESSGTHRWRTVGILQLQDGSSVISEGEIDLATRSWKGILFENS
jgi:hypothetical protein